MPRPRAEHPRDNQLLVRLTEPEMEALEAAAYLDKVTPNKYARKLVAAHIEALRTNEHVAAAIEIRRSYRVQRAATTQLREGATSIGREDAGAGGAIGEA